MRTKMGMGLIGVLVLAAVVGIAGAQSAPQLINYQGRLTDDGGQPLADGSTVDLTFAFHGVESGATPLYLTVLQEDVVVSDGIFNVLIGSGTVTAGTESSLAAVFQKHGDVWLGVQVDADAEMTPRARISSVPYAINAMSVDPSYLGAFIGNPDWDGDGYLKTGATVDCNDGNPAINPGVAEVCDDGIDNDCDAKIDGADNDAAEICDDLIDNDCDGLIDDADVVDCVNPPGMVPIPAGCFDMGDAFYEGGSDELPVHNVCITSNFYMDVFEVTNAKYAACVSGGGCTAPGLSSSYYRPSYYGNAAYDDFPVIYVSWDQATAYCTWAGKRLPTEAEWEYAARGGFSGMRYPLGDTMYGALANYWLSGDPWDNETAPVGYFIANGYGLHDMAGNVFEWTNDWYLATYYDVSPTNDPPGPATGTYRVTRGGSWADYEPYLRVSYRVGSGLPTSQNAYVGFRCAEDVVP